MNVHDATEQAYKNGYEAGYEAAYFEMGLDTENRKMTNYEKIKSMSVDEMAEFIGQTECRGAINNESLFCKFCETFNCKRPHYKQWLESETDNG